MSAWLRWETSDEQRLIVRVHLNLHGPDRRQEARMPASRPGLLCVRSRLALRRRSPWILRGDICRQRACAGRAVDKRGSSCRGPRFARTSQEVPRLSRREGLPQKGRQIGEQSADR
ncbi:hypothetical protein AI27_00985 [Sphingomonas sp. BHC-A]|nr:hypothetical protein AI27_00985 [Sphingomonas sp. BHC-A]